MTNVNEISKIVGLSLVLMAGAGCKSPTEPLINDVDNDGIPDEKEVAGQLYNGMPLYDWGARQNQRDLFVEIDYMDSTDGGNDPLDEGTVPTEAALQKIVDAFAANGIAVHFDVGDLFDQSGDASINPARFDLGGGEQLALISPLDLMTAYQDVMQSHFDSPRLSIFYYSLFGYSNSYVFDDGIPAAGAATIYTGGEGFIPISLITLGDYGRAGGPLNSSTAEEYNRLVNKQAETLMHELGHNLGLWHGGNEYLNNKPNYYSTMNYLYGNVGLPARGTQDEAAVYYYKNADRGLNPCGATHPVDIESITASLYSTEFILDFSHGTNAPIDEAEFDENLGAGTGSGIAIDLDCNGIIESQASGDITYGFDYDEDGNVVSLQTVLTDHNDWANLRLYYYEHPATQSSSVQSLRVDAPGPTFEIVNDPL